MSAHLEKAFGSEKLFHTSAAVISLDEIRDGGRQAILQSLKLQHDELVSEGTHLDNKINDLREEVELLELELARTLARVDAVELAMTAAQEHLA